jgi:uncharacterized protein YdeI (YjbR/CyaY-like superfamily)
LVFSSAIVTFRGLAKPLATPTFFTSPADFRRWLLRYHDSKAELWVGYYKKETRRRSITWPESVEEALCFGWIDGVRKAIDEISYAIRFTPRRKTSVWSAINIRNVRRLIETGRMQTPGLRAFEARHAHRCEIYSYEQRPQELPEALMAVMRKNKLAWKFFQAQPAGYRRQMTWWVVSAKTEPTQKKRLAQLIAISAQEQRLR